MVELLLDLRDAPIFFGVSEEELLWLRRQLIARPFKSGENLLECGREAPGLFVINSGLVSAFVSDNAGEEREVATLGKGECFGEIALMTGEPCSATVKAISDGEASLLGRDEFVDLLQRCPGLWRNIGRILSQRLVRTSKRSSNPGLANTVVMLTDCAEDEAAAMAISSAGSLARQTGKRVLLVDAREGSSCPISRLSPTELSPPISAVLSNGNSFAQHEAPVDPGNGLFGARIASLSGDGQPAPKEDECLTALERLKPFYDFVLLLERGDATAFHLMVIERAMSVHALITDALAPTPPWLELITQSANLREKLEMAVFTGDGRATRIVEEMEERTGKIVARLPAAKEDLRRLTGNGLSGGDVLSMSVDRLARQIGRVEVGIALGAGAAKGFAHIGVLRILEENSVPIDYIAGCSIGAIVGAMYAGGLSFPEIRERMHGADRKLRRWHLPFRSLWSDAGLKRLLRDPAPTIRFRDLQIPLAVVATDVGSGREIVIRKGLVWRAVQVSATVPGIFPPALIHKRNLVDGGLVNPVPSQTARNLGADIVIAVDLMSPSARAHHGSGPQSEARDSGQTRVPNLVEMLWRANEIMQEEVTLRSAATADVTIEPQLGRVRWSDFSRRSQEFIDLGEQAAMDKLPELQRLVPAMRPPA